MANKNKEKVIVDFIGNSCVNVTGSMVQITYPKKDKTSGKFLLECGMIQENKTPLIDYQVNQRMMEKVNAKDIEFLLLTHSHADHSANIPTLVHNGFEGKIYSTKNTMEIASKILVDSAYIHQRNIDYLQKKNKKVPPLFTMQDVSLAMNHFETCDLDKTIKVNEYISFKLIPSSHCLGSCQISIFIKKPSGKIEHIVYTGDLGNNLNLQPYVSNQPMIPKCNMLISECTYAQEDRCFSKNVALKEREDLLKTVKDYTSRGNRVLIPCFSFSRTQMLMKLLYDEFKDNNDFNIPVIVDGNLTKTMNQVYLKILKGEDGEEWANIMQWKNFIFPKEFKDSETWANKKNQPMIILASSGMISAGRVLTYTKSLIENKNDCICFCGYCSNGTLGHKIQNESQKTVTIDGCQYVKRSEIKKYKTFSSHIQKQELIEYFKTINAEYIILHHGNQEGKEELKRDATEELYKICKTTRIIATDQVNNRFIL